MTGWCSGPVGQGRGPPRSRASRARVSRPSRNRAGSSHAPGGMGSAARSMPGSRPVARWGGGGPPWASMSTRTSPEGPAATPGTARGSRRHQAVMRRGVGGGGADAVAPAARGQAGAGAGQVGGDAVPGAAGGAVAEGPFAGRRQRQDVPAERGQARARAGPGRWMRAWTDLQGVSRWGAGDAYRSPAAEPQLAPGGEPVPASPSARWGGGVGIPRPRGAGRGGGDGQVRNWRWVMSLMSAGPETVC